MAISLDERRLKGMEGFGGVGNKGGGRSNGGVGEIFG